MATIERALNAHSLYWVKNDRNERIGIIWGLDGAWRWSLGHMASCPADSFEAAKQSIETALGHPLQAAQRSAHSA
ncbi:MAG: hypothetical protein ACK5JM_11000 [Rhodoblastus sp.]